MDTHHSAGHAHGHDSPADWDNEEFVGQWLERQEERAAERRRQFVLLRALIPKQPGDEFSYLNLGAGPGNLDEVLLDHFQEASATLVDASLPMLEAAQKRLAPFGGRVEYVQADLGDEDWAGAVGGPFDFVVSTLAIHHLEDPRRIRALYTTVHGLIAHGGLFLNLEYLRPVRPELAGLVPWAAQDGEAGISAHMPLHEAPGTLAEQLEWLREAGFPCADVLWKELQTAVLCGVRDHLHLPAEAHGNGAAHSHGHNHDDHGNHDHDHGSH